jgi:acetoacetyl-CoA reductase
MRPDVLEKVVAGITVGRMGRPGEIARAVAFLCDDAAGYVTGALLAVNGGLYMGA